MTRIPITMSHGIREAGDYPMPVEHFDKLISIASKLGFTSIDYKDLAEWRAGHIELPTRPIMFDFDHPVLSMGNEIHKVLSNYGFHGTLFINTGLIHDKPDECLTWEQIAALVLSGWHIGAHTVTHPNLSKLFKKDPTGEILQKELEDCDAEIEKELGFKPRDFAFTGTSWSSAAEKRVMERYRFGRLWIVRNMYQADGEDIRYADLVNVEGEDEADGGPPMAARYITKDTHPYRLPSMELQCALMHEPDAFQRYLEGAIEQ